MAEDNEMELDLGIDIPENQEEHEQWIPTAQEQKALDSGWRPLDEWEGDPEDWVSAKEFNFRGDLMARITKLGRQVGTLEGELAQAKKVVANSDAVTQRMVEQAYKDAERDLKAQMRAANRAEDFEAADELEERLEELRATKKEVDAGRNEPAPATKKDETVDRSGWSPVQNAWYDFVTTTKWVQNPEIHNKLLRYADAQLAEDPTMGVGDFMDLVLTKGKELRGGGRGSPKGPDDNSTGSRAKGKVRGKGATARDLNPMQKEIARQMVSDGVCKSADEYAQMLEAEGAL